MDINIFVVFAITIVAIVALGLSVKGKLNEKGVEIHAYDDSRNEETEEKLR